MKVWLGSPSGRKRFSVLGAINAISQEIFSVYTDACVGSWTVIELLWKLRKRLLIRGVPISVVLDNASYQRSYLVQGAAKLMNIELLFLPPYSPNLNLIERFWKFVKRKTLASKQYDSFEEFCEAISTFTERAHIDHKDELETLLALKFQTLPEVTVLTA